MTPAGRPLPSPPARPARPAPRRREIVARENVPREVVRERVEPVRQQRPAPAPRPPVVAVRRGPSSRDLLLKALSSPAAARQAFVLREVLGPPVALRTNIDER
jgi:hypothetical protein